MFKKMDTFLEPVDFEQSNLLLKGNGITVKDMKVFTDNTYIISCWKLTWKQACHLLFRRKIWLSIMAEKLVPPVSLHIDEPFIKEGK